VVTLTRLPADYLSAKATVKLDMLWERVVATACVDKGDWRLGFSEIPEGTTLYQLGVASVPEATPVP